MHGGVPRGMVLLPRSAGLSTLQLRQPFNNRGSARPAPCLCLACKTVRCLGTADSRLSDPYHLPVFCCSDEPGMLASLENAWFCLKKKKKKLFLWIPKCLRETLSLTA